MADTPTEGDAMYQVVTMEGNPLGNAAGAEKGQTEDDAQHRCDAANAKAEKLGIVTRYKVIPA